MTHDSRRMRIIKRMRQRRWRDPFPLAYSLEEATEKNWDFEQWKKEQTWHQ